MSKCKNSKCISDTVGDRLYCSAHNSERIRELGGDPDKGVYKDAVFVKKPDLSEVSIPTPKNDKYYQDNLDYSEDDNERPNNKQGTVEQ